MLEFVGRLDGCEFALDASTEECIGRTNLGLRLHDTIDQTTSVVFETVRRLTCAGALDQAGILASFVNRVNRSSAEAIKRPSTRTVPVLIAFFEVEVGFVALVAVTGVEVFGASGATTAEGAGVPDRESSGVPDTITSFPWVSRIA